MQYFVETENGIIELLMKSKTANKTVFAVAENKVYVVASDTWVYDVCNQVEMGGCSYGRGWEIMTDIYFAEFNKVKDLYPGGLVYENPTKEELDHLLTYANELREDDLKSGDEESPFYREERFTITDLVAEIDLCGTPRDA